MAKKILFIVFILLSFTLLTACNSQKNIDQQVKDYIKQKYKFNVNITNREGKNEGNMGDRIFLVTKNNQPKIEFHVFLSGIINPKIESDDYPDQKKAYGYGQEFLKESSKKLNQIGYNQIKFSASANALDINVVSKEDITTRNQNSLNRLLDFVRLVNHFKEEQLQSETIHSIILNKKNSPDTIVLNNVNTITDINSLIQQLNKDPYFVNKSLFERDKTIFQSIEKDIKGIGFRYKYGLSVGTVKDSIFCYRDNIKNSECSGGYDLILEGPRDSKNLYKLAQTLKNQEIKIQNVYLPDKPSLLIENIEIITSSQQIDLILNRK